MEDKVVFELKGHQIEGLYFSGHSETGVVITHPHPLYGGNMYNEVVETIARAHWKKNISTLRFNFRGVGKSQGRHDNGIGEQEDLKAAIQYMVDTGILKVDIAGYSFGAWVNAHTDLSGYPIGKVVMVSPPVAFMRFDNVSEIRNLKQVVTGSEDDIAPPEHILKMIKTWNPFALFEVIEGADHFYFGYLDDLETVLADPG